MKTSTFDSTPARLEMAIIAFFVLAALCLLIVYIVDPAIYAQSLSLTSTPADRYPVIVTLFVVSVFAFITLLIAGVTRHWRWLFWLMLIAFGSAIIQIPVTFLQITSVLPEPYPRWYSLFRLLLAVIEIGLAIWMIQVYRHSGVWGRGKRRKNV